MGWWNAIAMHGCWDVYTYLNYLRFKIIYIVVQFWNIYTSNVHVITLSSNVHMHANLYYRGGFKISH